MNEELKKTLEQSVRILKSKGAMSNEEIKPVLISMEKLLQKRRTTKRVRRA